MTLASNKNLNLKQKSQLVSNIKFDLSQDKMISVQGQLLLDIKKGG